MALSPGALLGRLIVLLAGLCSFAVAAPAWAQVPAPAFPPARANHIAAELIAEGPAVPGETLTLALLFRPEPGWHGYWANPGDAGYGMRLVWDLPARWRAGEPLYPVPGRLVIAGLMNHVYEGEYAVLVPVEVPSRGIAGAFVPIALEAQWLACTDKICVPESASFTLRVPTAEGAGGAMPDPRFDQWRAAIPPLLDRSARFELTDEVLRIAVPLPASMTLGEPHVFIGEQQVVDYGAEQTFRRQGDLLIAEIPRGGLGEEPALVSGILALGGERGGLRFEAMPGAVPTGGERLAGGGAADAPLVLLVGGALLGGLLLNLMPCVFPILSLKALSLARAGESAAAARREGLAYTAGVVLACLALGGLLLALRAGGSEIGWAFQLQEPGVVLALLVLSVAITANFAGLFALPALSITRASGRSSAFATGLLAAFVATPCTGPFMAAALGAALLLSWEQALLLFAALGLGLALPFLLLGFVPPLRRLLPRPGPWMERFRRWMAVPMGLTALALAWLAWRQGGPWLVVAGLIGAAILVAALRGMARRREQGRPAFGGMVAASLALLLALAIALPRGPAPAESTGASILSPVAFDPVVLQQIVDREGKPVFLWFTADWCLTCKVNESVAIERESVREAFEQAGIVTMRGDWTRADAEIARFLADKGAAGVPLYLWYPAGGGVPEQLPQVLTADMLIERARAAPPPRPLP